MSFRNIHLPIHLDSEEEEYEVSDTEWLIGMDLVPVEVEDDRQEYQVFDVQNLSATLDLTNHFCYRGRKKANGQYVMGKLYYVQCPVEKGLADTCKYCDAPYAHPPPLTRQYAQDHAPGFRDDFPPEPQAGY